MLESKPFGPWPEGVRPILTQADFVEALRARREDLRLTLADLDHMAGFHEGYAAHLEKPFTRSGKRSFKLTEMGAIWLQSLGLQLAIVPLPDCRSSALGAANDHGTVDTGTHLRAPVPQHRKS